MKAKLANDRKKRQFIKVVEKTRKILKARMLDERVSNEDRLLANSQLRKASRRASVTQVNNRCIRTGRSRSIYRLFKLSRHELRRFAKEGRVPGFYKASW